MRSEVELHYRGDREGDEGDAELPRSPLSHAIATARDLLGLEIVCVSRTVRRRDLRDPQDEGDMPGPLPDTVVIVPLESAGGHLYGSLVGRSTDPERSLDERDAAYIRVLGRAIGAQIERAERDRDRRRALASTSGLQALVAAVEARDTYTGEHSRGVVDLSVRVAHELGLRERFLEEVEQVALLHDVGKVGIPDRILQKAGPLTGAEMETVKRHPAVGARIVASVGELAHLAPAIRSGHERWDGAGYPDGLAGGEIPLVSRITFVCDAYDAMISDRPYRHALAPQAAVAEVRDGAGSQFCPAAANALISVLEKGPAHAGARGRFRTSPPVR